MVFEYQKSAQKVTTRHEFDDVRPCVHFDCIVSVHIIFPPIFVYGRGTGMNITGHENRTEKNSRRRRFLIYSRPCVRMYRSKLTNCSTDVVFKDPEVAGDTRVRHDFGVKIRFEL